jgi:hypothetical protein
MIATVEIDSVAVVAVLVIQLDDPVAASAGPTF